MVMLMRELKKAVSITLDTSVIEKIQNFSECEDKSFSNYINSVLKAHIKSKEAENNAINK